MTTPVTSAGATGVIPFTTDFAAPAGSTALSPDGLLYYCQSRLGAIDTNIQQYFDDQKTQNAAMQDATKLLSIMHEGTWGTYQKSGKDIAGSPQDLQNHADKANELLDLYRSTASPEIKAKCAALFREVSGHDISEYGAPGAKVTSGDIAQAAAIDGRIPEVKEAQRTQELEDIKGTQSDMSKSAEMNMIQLQSLVQQRQLAVQLTTQLMQTMHDTSKQVLGNIR